MLESLIEKEQIQTTYAKAKECQRMAEKLITLGKKNTQASKNRASQIFYVCEEPIFQTWIEEL
jgi:ribosomal protein L17